jgi:Fe-S cluster assembly protein SufA|tara:strand:+ start:2436 stop:2789 length:354 start_codon:yes stop_codon:yes gene_type:complete
MSVETFSINDYISVTAKAAKHFASHLEKTGAKAVRLSLKEAGCTGFKYVVDMVETIESDDIKLVLENGVEFYIDPKALSAVKGMDIDLVQEGVNRSIKFNNPNVTDECGCGESFSVS